MILPRFLSKLIPGFNVIDVKEWISKGHIDIYVTKADSAAPRACFRCQTPFQRLTGHYRQKIQAMPILQFKTFVYLKRAKGFCPGCKKIRAEHLEFICPETPHLTRDYAWWLVNRQNPTSFFHLAFPLKFSYQLTTTSGG